MTPTKTINHLWFLQPLIYIVFVWLITNHPEQVKQFTPKLINFSNMTVSDVFPLFPTDPSTIMKLAEIRFKNEPDMLEQASKLLNFTFTTIEQFDQFMTELQQSQLHAGVLEKVWRMCTFINVMWIVSIIGLTVTFLPFAVHILRPFAFLFNGLFLTFLITYSTQLIYGLLLLVMSQTVHMNKHHGFYVALLSLFGYYLVTSSTYPRADRYKYNDTEDYGDFVLCCVPTVMLTLFYQSNLLGFLSMAFMFGSIGFSILSNGVCTCIGFESKDALERCVAVAMMLIPVYYYFTSITNRLKYFHYGAYVFGPIVYLLGLLILAFDTRKANANLWMIVSLIAMMYFSTITFNSSMFNVSVVFTGLFMLEKFATLIRWDNFIVPMFLFFGLIYYVSMYLSSHPQMITSIIYHHD